MKTRLRAKVCWSGMDNRKKDPEEEEWHIHLAAN